MVSPEFKMEKENDNTSPAIRTKLNGFAKAALILFCIAAVLALLSIYLLVTAESVQNEGESGGITAMVFGGVAILLILPATGIAAFIGCIVGIISLCRTSYKQGRIVLILNFLLCCSCSLYLWAFHSGLILRMKTGQSKLDYDLQQHNFRAVDKDIQRGANINAIDKNGLAPLHIAIRDHNRKLFDNLLAAHADVNITTIYYGQAGRTPLYYVAASGPKEGTADWDDLEIATILLKRGANPNLNTSDGISPLTVAYGAGKKDLVELLLRSGANVNVLCGQRGRSLLHVAIEKQDSEMVKTLLAHGADMKTKDAYNQTPLDFAVFCGKREIIEILISTHPEALNGGAISMAAQTGQMEILKFLVDRDPNMTKDGPGEAALCSAKTVEIAEFLLSKGVDVNANKARKGDTPLHNAAYGLNADMVRCLIAHGADVNARNSFGQTPLHRVTANWSREVAEILIANGADIYAKDNRGRTFISIAHSDKREAGPGERLQATLELLQEIQQGKMPKK